MKIIGKAGDGFILQASGTEVANLCGFYYGGSEGCPKFEVGTDVKIAAMFSQLYKLSGRAKALKKIAADLREHADLLEAKVPVVEPFESP